MKVEHDEQKKKFFVKVDGYEAHVAYDVHDGAWDIRHTVVPKPIGGRGIASMLVKQVYDEARARGMKCMATCSYAVLWLQRHPEYEGIVSDEHAPDACAL